MKPSILFLIVLGTFVLVFEGCSVLAVNNCTWGQFKCDNGRCVKYTFRCDGDGDCDDNSDEKECGEACINKYFKCKNGNCVSREHMCDGDNDCGDESDEKQFLCGSGSAPLTCFLCNATGSSNCSANQVECSRSLGYTRCARFSYVKKGENIIESTCAKKSDCTSEGMKKECQKRGDGCKMQCCAKNRCNEAISFNTSISWSPKLNCYECSIRNWETCKTQVTCSGNDGYDRCFKMSYYRVEIGQEVHVIRTGCATKSNCTGENTLCTGVDGTNCKLQCCANSTCNVPKNNETNKPNLKCYTCSSNKSYQDCDKQKVLRTCNDNEDRCYVVQITDHNNDRVSRMHYMGCTPASKCSSSTHDVCKLNNSTSCTVKCCTGNGCNVSLASSLSVSRFVLVTCAIYVYSFIGMPV